VLITISSQEIVTAGGGVGLGSGSAVGMGVAVSAGSAVKLAVGAGDGLAACCGVAVGCRVGDGLALAVGRDVSRGVGLASLAVSDGCAGLAEAPGGVCRPVRVPARRQEQTATRIKNVKASVTKARHPGYRPHTRSEPNIRKL
jgi:hypothetical protein